MKKTALSLFMIFTLSLTLVVFIGCDNQDIPEFEDDGSISILFVGNSFVFFGDVPGQLQSIAGANGVDITYVDISAGGATLSSSSRNAIREMRNRRFDFVVLQDQSQRPLNDIGGFLSNVSTLSNMARETGAIPVLYNPAWANIDGQPDEELQNRLTAAYQRAARENDAILVNAGDAWVYAYREIPGLSLYHDDGFHANYAGAFLTASVFAATLFDLRVEEIPSNSSGTIDLANAAWSFVHTAE